MINQSMKDLSEQMLLLYINMGKMGRFYMPGNDNEKGRF